MVILGISCYFHDSAACIVDDGKIIAACQEERFSRKKNDSNFPTKAIKFCLNEAGITIRQVDHITISRNLKVNIRKKIAHALSYKISFSSTSNIE